MLEVLSAGVAAGSAANVLARISDQICRYLGRHCWVLIDLLLKDSAPSEITRQQQSIAAAARRCQCDAVSPGKRAAELSLDRITEVTKHPGTGCVSTLRSIDRLEAPLRLPLSGADGMVSRPVKLENRRQAREEAFLGERSHCVHGPAAHGLDWLCAKTDRARLSAHAAAVADVSCGRVS